LARVKGVPYLPIGSGVGVVILDHEVNVLLSYNPTNILWGNQVFLGPILVVF
jgi:hypothetical protein